MSPVRLLEELRAEHELIDRAAGSLRAFARLRVQGQGSAQDGPRFVTFFRLFAGQYHHGREEDTLFVALQRHAELPGDRGPIAALLGDHHRLAELLDRMEPLAGSSAGEEITTLLALTLEYSERLWHHIDAENSVLLPESENRLRRHGRIDLPTRDPSHEEEEARLVGEQLVAAYPPAHEPAVMRGDGCVACPAFTSTCRGVEREWWNEWEWEEFEDHLPSG